MEETKVSPQSLKISNPRTPCPNHRRKTPKSKGRFRNGIHPNGKGPKNDQGKRDPSVPKEKELPKPEVDDDLDEIAFPDYDQLTKRMGKTLYFSSKLPSTARPSLPLTSKCNPSVTYPNSRAYFIQIQMELLQHLKSIGPICICFQCWL